MLRTVVLLRHAAPQVQPDEPPSRWPLTDRGRQDAAGLAGCLPDDAMLASSPEVKAVRTLLAAATVGPDSLHVDARFGEVSRPDEPFDDHYRDRRLAWVTGALDERHRGWETPQQAAARFQAGLDDLDAESAVIASHGMVMVAWLIRMRYVSQGTPAGALWTTLGFPDLLRIQVA